MSAGIESRYLMRDLGMSCSGEYIPNKKSVKKSVPTEMYFIVSKYIDRFIIGLSRVIYEYNVSDIQKERIREIVEYKNAGCPGTILYEDDLKKSSIEAQHDYTMKMKKLEKLHLTYGTPNLLDREQFTYAYAIAYFDAEILASYTVMRILKNQAIHKQYTVNTAVRILQGQFAGAKNKEDIHKRYKELGLEATRSSIKIDYYDMFAKAYINDFMNTESIVFEAEERIARGEIIDKKEEARIKSAADLYYRGIYDGCKGKKEFVSLEQELGFERCEMSLYEAQRIINNTRIQILNHEPIQEEESRIKQAANIIYRNNYSIPPISDIGLPDVNMEKIIKEIGEIDDMANTSESSKMELYDFEIEDMD